MMKVLNCFDHAFVINLDQDIERMAETKRELASHSIPFERFPGVRLDVPQKGKFGGRYGCLLAHISAIREAKRRAYRSVLVMEDDVVLRSNFLSLWSNLIPQVHALQYDLLYAYRWDRQTPLLETVRLISISGTLCTHFYAVHSSFYDRYLELAELQLTSPRLRPIDRIFRAPGIRIFATSCNLAGQRPGHSNISKNNRLKAMFNQKFPRH